jgi:hypothetical protein
MVFNLGMHQVKVKKKKKIIICTVTSLKASAQAMCHSANILFMTGIYRFGHSNGILATSPDVPNYFLLINLNYNKE